LSRSLTSASQSSQAAPRREQRASLYSERCLADDDSAHVQYPHFIGRKRASQRNQARDGLQNPRDVDLTRSNCRSGNPLLQKTRSLRFLLGSLRFFFKPFFALDVPRERASSAVLDGIKSRTDRKPSGIHYRFQCGIHTTHFHNQSIACWRFLGTRGRLHPLNFSLQRLRSELALRKSSGQIDLSPELRGRKQSITLPVCRGSPDRLQAAICRFASPRSRCSCIGPSQSVCQ
jgi:hypothetical protein